MILLKFIFGSAESSLLRGLSPAAASRGHSLVLVHGFLIAVASLILWNTGYARHVDFSNCSSQALACELSSCILQALIAHEACGIFPDQE